MTDPHDRRCFDCGHVDRYLDWIAPECLCRKCGSQDTRRVKDKVPLKPKPESQETFDVSFRYKPGATDIDRRTKKLAEELRELAADKAREWLLDHGYFNGRFETTINHDAKERRVDVKVVVTCYGLPEAKFERVK